MCTFTLYFRVVPAEYPNNAIVNYPVLWLRSGVTENIFRYCACLFWRARIKYQKTEQIIMIQPGRRSLRIKYNPRKIWFREYIRTCFFFSRLSDFSKKKYILYPVGSFPCVPMNPRSGRGRETVIINNWIRSKKKNLVAVDTRKKKKYGRVIFTVGTQKTEMNRCDKKKTWVWWVLVEVCFGHLTDEKQNLQIEIYCKCFFSIFFFFITFQIDLI